MVGVDAVFLQRPVEERVGNVKKTVAGHRPAPAAMLAARRTALDDRGMGVAQVGFGESLDTELKIRREVPPEITHAAVEGLQFVVFADPHALVVVEQVAKQPPAALGCTIASGTARNPLSARRAASPAASLASFNPICGK